MKLPEGNQKVPAETYDCDDSLDNVWNPCESISRKFDIRDDGLSLCTCVTYICGDVLESFVKVIRNSEVKVHFEGDRWSSKPCKHKVRIL